MDAFAGLESVIFIVSADSGNVSSVIGMVKVLVVCPAAKVSVPEDAV